MAYTLHDDNVASDARWVTLAKLQEPDGVPDLLALSPSRRRKYLARLEVRKALMIAAYFVMQSESARNTADGYITQEAALACCTEPWILQALLTPVCGKPPLLHQEGQKCGEKNCIDASGPWKPNYEYRVCAFLKRNPSKAEQDRRKTQRAELTDSTLRTAVYERDGGCCRYCRSGPLGRKGMGNAKDRRRIPQIDHIDPDEPAGPGPDYKGVVLSCAVCNEYKQKRTPEEADMDLLPEPTSEQIAYWAERGEQQFNRPARGAPHPADAIPDEWLAARDNPPDNEINNAEDNAQTTSRTTSPTVVDHVAQGRPGHAHDAPDARAADLVSAGGATSNARDNPPEPSGSGRVGHTPPEQLKGPPTQPDRAPDAPDIYTRQIHAPPDLRPHHLTHCPEGTDHDPHRPAHPRLGQAPRPGPHRAVPLLRRASGPGLRRRGRSATGPAAQSRRARGLRVQGVGRAAADGPRAPIRRPAASHDSAHRRGLQAARHL